MKHMFDCDKIESKKKQFLTKADLILLAVVLIAAFILLFFLKVNRTPGSHAALSYDGRLFMQIPLSRAEPKYYLVLWNASSDEEQTSFGNDSFENIIVQELSTDTWNEEAEALLTEAESSVGTDTLSVSGMDAVDTTGGAVEYNLFSCENGEIRMIRSSCPDLICVHHRPVSSAGENIICLPHKLVIEIIGMQENELDGVVY